MSLPASDALFIAHIAAKRQYAQTAPLNTSLGAQTDTLQGSVPYAHYTTQQTASHADGQSADILHKSVQRATASAVRDAQIHIAANANQTLNLRATPPLKSCNGQLNVMPNGPTRPTNRPQPQTDALPTIPQYVESYGLQQKNLPSSAKGSEDAHHATPKCMLPST